MVPLSLEIGPCLPWHGHVTEVNRWHSNRSTRVKCVTHILWYLQFIMGDMLISGTHFTNSVWAPYPNLVKIHVHVCASVTWRMMSQSSHNFAQVTTAELLWHVQNCDLIGSSKFELKHKKMIKKILVMSSLNVCEIGSSSFVLKLLLVSQLNNFRWLWSNLKPVWWLSPRLWYLQYNNNGDTTLLC